MTIDWQRLTPNNGFVRPELVEESGVRHLFDESMERSAALYDLLKPDFAQQASYAVAMAYRIRYSMQFNARSHSSHRTPVVPSRPPSYRRVVLEMHRLIAEEAGHKAIANSMTHLTTEAPDLERLDSERRAEARRVLER